MANEVSPASVSSETSSSSSSSTVRVPAGNDELTETLGDLAISEKPSKSEAIPEIPQNLKNRRMQVKYLQDTQRKKVTPVRWNLLWEAFFLPQRSLLYTKSAKY
eukprot:TRINITY_DN15285_c0_g1_i1.p1 TRINITY_DN15285_c0_g1~~TRINITY_DN15285_c0_g1_i1.p1  ORF type:complete len:104 (-),score=7.36 TRINITY_DN15285_c0_g1_i1:87-398(-)